MLFDLILGFGVSFFTAQGDAKTVTTLRKLKSAKDSGADIDAHMQEVADRLVAGDPLDWDRLDADIDRAVDQFLS